MSNEERCKRMLEDLETARQQISLICKLDAKIEHVKNARKALNRILNRSSMNLVLNGMIQPLFMELNRVQEYIEACKEKQQRP